MRIIDRVARAEPETFNNPNDIAADQEGNLYVADTNNNRVIVMDRELNYIKSFTKPIKPLMLHILYKVCKFYKIKMIT